MAKSQGRIGPYSAVVQRGVIGDTIDGRSREGRLARHMEAELVKHVGGAPSFVQRLQIEQAVKVRLRLDAFEAKPQPDWTDLDSRTYGGLLNRYRLILRDLGLKPAAANGPNLADHLARRTAQREGPTA